ncbi:pyridoxamine kinase [Streptococcus macacae]|uniref:pyridoxal kinase n=1 Tax=Streptococcus macacae NCTC 11558 TaxID=764298 RepID=G5JU54_9STRE|nr:pyridoxamine kinase [Streptococcus macacae]EHJ53272.1 phosphomethylpyrimidine kinase [Streptococcus macacae NCTC 11558]SUN78419.1 pyridoxamine kinase [Streptococcus macacae NCTC 11558]
MSSRLLIANDLPGLGKVALGSALPVMAACQVETAVLPTVLLSSHTGGFSHVHIADLTADMQAFLHHWEKLPISFDGLVTGYLKNIKQIDLLLDFADKKQLPLFVDPVMADKGRFYKGFDQEYANRMKQLCQKADVIIPNLTEAAFLTNMAFLIDGYKRVQIEELLRKLGDLGPKYVILTGVSLEQGKIGLAIYEKAVDKIIYLMSNYYDKHFWGTGDILTAILASLYFQGIDLKIAGKTALTFLNQVLLSTIKLDRDLRFGLYFEPHLLELAQNCVTLKEEKDGK